MTLLSSQEITQELSGLSGWNREDHRLVKRYEFIDFVTAIRFVRRVAQRAESAGHHPDILINYNRVTLALSTHSEGGITKKDIHAAWSFDQAVEV